MNLLVILASKFPVTVQFWCRYNRMHHRTRSQGAPLAPVPRPLRLNTIIVVNILDHNIVLSASLLYHLINMTRLGAAVSSGVEVGGAGFSGQEQPILPTEAQRRWSFHSSGIDDHFSEVWSTMLYFFFWQGDYRWRAGVPVESPVPDIWETQRGGKQSLLNTKHFVATYIYCIV